MKHDITVNLSLKWILAIQLVLVLVASSAALVRFFAFIDLIWGLVFIYYKTREIAKR